MSWTLSPSRSPARSPDPDDPRLRTDNVGQSTSRHGEDISDRDGKEAGRQDTGPQGGASRRLKRHPAGVAARADVLITMLPGPAAVTDVGSAGGLRHGPA
jgi:hypothetical protein